MFEHGGFKALWPVIFFLPWLFVGVASLLKSVLDGRVWVAPIRHVYGPHPGMRPTKSR
jgi:hypothetical protein